MNERYWRTDQELFEFLRTIEDVSRSSINLSALIFFRSNLIIDSFIELRVIESSGSLARDKILSISSLVNPSLERSEFSYDANLEDSSLTISSGTFASETASLNSEDEEKDLKITLKRERIKTKSVRDLNSKGDYPLLEDRIGYVRLGGFSENTATELEAALTKMEEAGLKGLVLDLRDNPGGLLTQSARVAEKFIKEGQLIVSTEGRGARELDRLVATVIGHRTLPMVILINGGSASASEIVAGCLQDLKRAELIGTRTFGKGSVQTVVPINESSAVKLTTALYFTPSGKSIQAAGIIPDIVIEPAEIRLYETFERAREENLSGHLSTDPKVASDETDKNTEENSTIKDNQLYEALNILIGTILLSDN